MSEELFKVGTVSEEDLKKLEEEPVDVGEVENKELLDIFTGEYVEKEYIVVDIQRPDPERVKSNNIRKIDLYVLNEVEPLTVDIHNPKLKEIIKYINEFKIVKIKVKQLKIRTLEDNEIKEYVARDIEEILSVEPLEPLEYFKKNQVRYGIVKLRKGKTSAYLREDGIIKIVVSGYTVNGWRLNSSLHRDKLMNVFLVPAITVNRDGTEIVRGCWFMLRKKEEEKTEEQIEEEVERLAQEAEAEITGEGVGVKEIEDKVGRFKVEEEK